jgi:uncharacterized membrane protein HdeD (DUF308 family)
MSEASGSAGLAPSNDIRYVMAGIGRHWGWLLAFGILSIAFGAVLLVWPGRTILVLAVFLGAYLLVSGIFQIVGSFTAEGASGGFRALMAISGALSVILGLIAFRSAAHAVAILVLLIGFGWIFHGIAQLMTAIADHTLPSRGWYIFMGILSVVAGFVVLLWPAPSLLAVAVFAGIWLVVLGIVEIVAAFRLRSLAHSL